VLTDFCRVCNRLNKENSYINSHIYPPGCVRTNALATICRCEDGHSLFNCTTDDKEEKVTIFRTTETDSCTQSGGSVGQRRRKRSNRAVVQAAMDDDIISKNDYPPPRPPGNPGPIPSPRTWPTPSGITKDQATEECYRRLETSAAFSVVQKHVEVEPAANSCELNIQACRYGLISSYCTYKTCSLSTMLTATDKKRDSNNQYTIKAFCTPQGHYP